MARLSVRSNVFARGVGGDLKWESPDAALAPSADASTASADLTTALTDTDLVASTASNGLVALLGSAVAYSTTTKQYSGTMGGNATITPTQGAALYALLNTQNTALLAVKTALVGAPIASDVVLDVNLATVTSRTRLIQKLIDMVERFRGVIA